MQLTIKTDNKMDLTNLYNFKIQQRMIALEIEDRNTADIVRQEESIITESVLLDEELIALHKQNPAYLILSEHIQDEIYEISTFSEEIENILLLFKTNAPNPERNVNQFNNYMMKDVEFQTKFKNEAIFDLQQMTDEFKETEAFLSSFDAICEEKYEEIDQKSLEIENTTNQYEYDLNAMNIVEDGCSKDFADFQNMFIDWEKELEKAIYLDEEKEGILIDLLENVKTLREAALVFNN